MRKHALRARQVVRTSTLFVGTSHGARGARREARRDGGVHERFRGGGLATRLDGVAAARRPFVRRAIGRLVLANNNIIYIYMCYSATG